MPTAQENLNTTNTPIQRKNRAQLAYALFDVDFFHKPTIKALRYRFKSEGLCAYQEIIFQLSRASNACVTRDTCVASAEEFGICDADLFLNYCFERGLLHKDGELVTQERVILDQEKLAKRREAIQERVDKFRSKKRKKRNALPTRYETRSPVTDTVTDTDPIDLIKGIELPITLNTQVGRDALTEWLQYKQERGERYKTSRGIKKLIKEFEALGAERLRKAVDHSIAKNYAGCFEPKNGSEPTATDPRRKNLETLKKMSEGINPWADDPLWNEGKL